MKKIILPLLILSLIFASCHKKDMFEQPDVEITGFSLKDLPGDSAYLDIDIKVTNNDKREAHISDIEYTAVIEGVTSGKQYFTVDKDILTDSPLELTLPLSLKTDDAVKLLAKLDKGEELTYTVTGTFHADEPVLKLFDLPIDVGGTAAVDIGFENFFKQPDITVNNIDGTYTENSSNTIFDFDVACLVTNNENKDVVIDEVEYVVYIEGVKSETQLYSNSYSEDINLGSGGNFDLNLPVSFVLNTEEGNALADAINDGTIDYTVEGVFHVKNLNGASADFSLPLYVEGNIPSDIVGNLFEQPTIEVTGYTLLELPDDSTRLSIDIIVTNNDSREAYIQDINYQVETNGVISSAEHQIINQTLLVGTPLELTLPVTFKTNEAAELLSILDAGQSLNYHVTGTFHVDEPVINLFDLPIDITGTAYVDTGFEDFYEQPETTVNDFDGTYTINGSPVPTSITFYLNVNTTIQNMDSRDVTMDEVEYIVTVEGQVSNTHYYSDTYSSDLNISGNGSVNLTLPVTLTLPYSEGLSFIDALSDGYADYIVEGTFHAIQVEGMGTVDFQLPLYDTGSAPVTSLTQNKK